MKASRAILIAWLLTSGAAAKETIHYQLTPDGKISGFTLSDWIAHLKDPNPEIRRSAAETLGKIYPDEAKVAVPHLIPLLEDTSEAVRQAAAETLGGFGSD